MTDAGKPTDTATDRSPARYTGPDRRKRPTPMLSRFTFRGRRRNVDPERYGARGYYVDRQSRFEVVTVCVLFGLTAIDALATVYALRWGAEEVNPIMRAALQAGDGFFLFAKIMVSVAGALVLLLHARFPGVRRVMFGLVAVYLAVLLNHGVMMLRVARELMAGTRY